MEIGHLDKYLKVGNIKTLNDTPHQLQALPITTWKEKAIHDIQDTVIKSSLCDSDNVNYNTANAHAKAINT